MNDVKKIDCIIPSWENAEMLMAAKNSIIANTAVDLRFFSFGNAKINKGWMGFCNEGMTEALKGDSEYILLSNDDILVSPTADWGKIVLKIFEDNPKIGAVGPLTNRACGWSTLNQQNCLMSGLDYLRVPFLSHFFVVLRTAVIKQIGLLDEDLPGGDDLDYSIRLNQAGFYTVVTPKIYVEHRYAQTGKKIYGNYWDSEDHTDKINTALIRKHGFKKFTYAMFGYEEAK